MAEPITEQPPPPAPDPNSTHPPPSDFDSISIPPFDDHFGSDQTPIGELMSDLGFPDGEFELTFDGMDDLYFPAENESFLIPINTSTQEEHFGDFTPESEASGISGDSLLPKDDAVTISGCCNRESPRDDSDDRCSGADRTLDLPTPLSSQGSGNCGSDVSEATNESSPKSGNVVVDQKVKVEEAVVATTTTSSITKRKKEIEEDLSDESRNSKYRRSGEDADASAVTGEEDEKKKARLMRNRESAQLSRQRKKHYVEELEEKVRNMHSTITDLNGKISYFMAENATLRQQLGGNGMCPPHHPPPPMGMYPPMAPMPYPWMPCPPYMVKQQGSQVPLIPIPRLKPQNPLGTSKAKKSESKKSEAKTKKVASISFLGLLFCLFLFGALAPIVNVNYGGISGAFYGNYRSNYITDQVYSQHRDRVLDASRSGAGTGVSNSNNGIHCGRDSDQGTRKNISATDSSVPPGNGSEPLVASLFVPRNDKLVKIDGNLIINSILASEKAVASRKASESNERNADLVIPKDYSPALPLPDVGRTEEMAKHLYRSKAEKQKALSSGSADTLKDQFKTIAANGEMQQWFREGVAGPMFSSGMCTEVFQFDVSSTSGAIIPATPATNVSAEHGKNTTDTHKRKNRRILRGLPIPLPGSDFNLTKEHQRNSSSKEIKPASSMVVSVLVDPREGGDGDIEGMIGGPKSLSRVFVVVLLDSAKYVTYSCVLPRSGAPHLVTT
ncbi:PREDICTED: bZIP transcription factor 17 [Camelina sativa]|uniref:BZIP transcription factor 17 n=1 Tax=Camelina sativa TaxID=90675 RepID=A0ABM0Z0N6_CAMSA|nr:PREDICTED: bZIP transcription factor 17 [Camelina sativa]